jgi:hypothetical protein
MISGSDGRIRNRHIPARPHEYLGGRAAGISRHVRNRDFVGYCDRSSWRFRAGWLIRFLSMSTFFKGDPTVEFVVASGRPARSLNNSCSEEEK